MRTPLLSALPLILLLFQTPAWAQGKPAEPAPVKPARSAAQAVQEGEIMEAVRLVKESPDVLEGTVRTLLATADYLVGERRIADAQATLDKTQAFLLAFGSATGQAGMVRDPLRGRQLRLEGIKLTDAGRFSEAVVPLQEALEISRKMRDPVLEASVHNNLGVTLQSLGKLEEAKGEFQSAIRMAEEQHDIFRAASAEFNLGRVLLQIKQYSPALESFKRAELQFKSASKADLEARAVMMQGITLSRSDAAGSEALKFFEKAQKMFEQAADQRNAGWTFYLMGSHVAQNGKFDEAASYGERAIPYLTSTGDQSGLRQCYEFLADMYDKAGKKDQAAKYRSLAGPKPK